MLRVLPSVFLSGMLLVVASPLHGTSKVLCWAAAATVDHLGPLVGHMRGWRLSPLHFVERFGQIILIALGESVVAIGVGVAGLELDPGLIIARDVYSYLHLPMVGGIVLFAFGLETALHDTARSLAIVPAFGLVCGISLYLIAHVALRLRIGGETSGTVQAAQVVTTSFPAAPPASIASCASTMWSKA